MAATAAAFAEFASGAAGTEAAATAVASEAAGAGLGLGASVGGAASAGLGVNAALAGAAGAAGSALSGPLGQILVGQGLSKLMAPKIEAPAVKPPNEMPDPLAQQESRDRSIAEQLARRGRAATILTDSGSGKLGG